MKEKLIIVMFLLTLLLGANTLSFAETKDINAGFAQEEGDWIYYLDDVEFGTLSKIKKDGTGYEPLLKLQANEFIKLGDWIYYISSFEYYQGQGELYRIHISGSDKEKIYDGQYWSKQVQNLQYTQGLLTFYAGTNYKLDPETLTYEELNDFSYHKTNAVNGQLIGKGYDGSIDIYDLQTSERVSYNWLEDSKDIVFDSNWVYFYEYDRDSGLDSIYKAQYDGSHKSVIIPNVKYAENLQLFDGVLYYNCALKNENMKYVYNQFHKFDTQKTGAIPELVTSKVLGEYSKISNVIDNKIYFKDYDYLSFFNKQTKKPVYYSLRSMYMGEQSIAINERENLLFIKNNQLIELTPELNETILSDNLRLLNRSEMALHTGSIVKYYNNVVGVKSNNSNIQVIKLNVGSYYEIEESDDYNLLGLDDLYIYFTGDRNDEYIYKLYRLPIGIYDLSKKQEIYQVETPLFFDGYVIDQKTPPRQTDYGLYKFSLKTLKADEIYSVFIYGADVFNGDLYYVKGNNGGIYKTSLTNNSVHRVYSNNQWASNVAVDDTNMYIGTWQDSIQFVKTDLQGKNLEQLGTDTVGHFIDVNSDYVIFNSLFKYARVTEGTQNIELMYDLQKALQPADNNENLTLN